MVRPAGKGLTKLKGERNENNSNFVGSDDPAHVIHAHGTR